MDMSELKRLDELEREQALRTELEADHDKRINRITSSIRQLRGIYGLDCNDLRTILNTLSCEMASAGYCEGDVQSIDEVTDLICG